MNVTMSLSIQPYKGARDFYPEDKRLQNYIFNTIRQVVRSFGYEEYDAPILEPLDLYKAKTGDEIVNEQVYSFTDRGGREVAIRPEMTPTVSRMVAARRQELPYPVRWFSIPNLWRYERPQRGRLREHWQLNVDIFGEDGVSADHELIQVVDSILKAFGATSSMYQVKINNRELIDALIKDYLGLNETQAHALVKLIDRMRKLDQEVVNKTIADICEHDAAKIQRTTELLQVTSLDQLPAEYKDHPATVAIQELLDILNANHIDNAVFDISLMRGFDYYTGLVFEVFDTNPENNRSMFGGGRYDGLVGLFGVEPVPTAGFGMGDVTLANFLESHKLLPKLATETDVLLVLIGDVYSQAGKVVRELREEGLNVAVDASSRKLDKKLKAADKRGIRFVMFVGEDELAAEQYPLKDLVTGKEEKHGVPRIITTIQDYRTQVH